jgi:hypothetical protein
MNEIQSLIQSLADDSGLKLMRAPYDYAMQESLNVCSNAHCSICGRQLSINEWTHQNDEKKQVCNECFDYHVFPVYFSNVYWFYDMNYVIDDENPHSDERWLYEHFSNPLYFTEWLNNQPDLRNEIFMFIDKLDERKRPIIKTFFLPQFIEKQANSRFFYSWGINLNDCSFLSLDTFPNFHGKYEEIIVIYNKQDMKHYDTKGNPLDLKLNPMSHLLGKDIMGCILFVNASLITDQTFDDFERRKPLDFSEIENYDRTMHGLYR